MKKENGAVALDTTLTPALLSEGAAREMMRLIQDLRKKAKLNPVQTVNVYIEASPTLKQMLQTHAREIQEKVRAETLVFARPPTSTTHAASDTIKNESVKVSIIPE